MTNYEGKYVLARGIQSGVYFGILKSRTGKETELSNCRNIWSWSGATNLNQLANDGVKNPEQSKISVESESITLLDVVEIIPCTDKAIENLKGVKAWKY